MADKILTETSVDDLFDTDVKGGDPLQRVAEQLSGTAARHVQTRSKIAEYSEDIEALADVGGKITHKRFRIDKVNVVGTGLKPEKVDVTKVMTAPAGITTSLAPGRNPDWVTKPAELTPEQLGQTPAKNAESAPVVKTTSVTTPEVTKFGKGLAHAVPSKDCMILRPIIREVDARVHHSTLVLFDRTQMSYDAEVGDSMVYHSRNILIGRFLKSEYEWALFWDDDIIPPIGNAGWSRSNLGSIPTTYPDKFLNVSALNRLKSHGKTLVGGFYVGRKPPYAPICHRTTQNVGDLKRVPREELLATEWVGTGFLLIHRSVFADIATKFPELAPKSDAINPWEKEWDFFNPAGYAGEDVAFCQRAKSAGHQPYVDLSTVCLHVGSYAFGPWNNQ